MIIPRYWAKETLTVPGKKGKPIPLACWRWSNDSQEDARRQAAAAIQTLALRFQSGQPLDRYSYGMRPLREEIIQPIPGAQEKEVAVITRNAYGALVLNTERVMFADIDFPQQKTSLAAGLVRLFSSAKPAFEVDALKRIEDWIVRYPGIGLRVYQTAAGLRCLFTSHIFDPTQSSTVEMLRGIGSDPLYVNLCRGQQCFRARLTPKPWRIGLRGQPPNYPRQDIRQEEKYARWLSAYQSATPRFTVCRLIKQLGDQASHPEAARIVQVHDQIACANPQLKLA
jgi:hypothetical protein